MEGRGDWGCSEGLREMAGSSSRSLKIGGSGGGPDSCVELELESDCVWRFLPRILSG